MNILHVFKCYFPNTTGGIERVIYDLTDCQEDHSFKVLSTGPGKNIITSAVNGVEVTYMPAFFEFSSTPFFNFFDNRVKDLLRWADIVHYHYPWPLSDLMSLTVAKDKKYIVTYHSDVVKQKFLDLVYSPLRRFFLRKASFVVATSQNYIESSSILSALDNLEVIPIGLDEKFGQIEIEVVPRRPYFFFVGVHRYYKGLSYLVRAAARLDCDVIIAGDGPETDKLKRLAQDLRAKNVLFVGRISDEEKIRLLKGCLAFVLPSHLRSEAFGVCLLEAMALAKPLITTNIQSGMSFVNDDGTTGFCVEPCSEKALRSAMEVFINNNNLVIQMGAAAQQRFFKLFTSRAMRDKYNQLYFRIN